MPGQHAETSRHELTLELERRPHFRVQTATPLHFMSSCGQGGEAVIRAIGMGGACIDLPVQPVVPGTLLMHFPAGDRTTGGFDVEAQVAWTVTDKIVAPYPTGVAFVDLPADTRKRLVAFITSLIG